MSLPRDQQHLERIVSLGPIVHDFTDLERAVAKSGYLTYHEGRHARPWRPLSGNCP